MRPGGNAGFALVLAGSALLAGCADADIAELEARMEAREVEARGNGEPLPDLDEPESPAVRAAGRNPMAPPPGSDEPEPEGAGGPSPEAGRQPGPLEAFSLDSLRLVGVMGDGGRRVGLVEDPDGRLHAVPVGAYMGRNHGRVQRIGADAIELRELIETEEGWEERMTSLTRGQQ